MPVEELQYGGRHSQFGLLESVLLVVWISLQFRSEGEIQYSKVRAEEYNILDQKIDM